ncbi:MAG: hypothetical protein D6815_05485 [Candidatus Dadabacteria bacterium]|nr:MAG: hypothetical protein D6815_05485 [Candidatus Dadabacteria bacterium]
MRKVEAALGYRPGAESDTLEARLDGAGRADYRSLLARAESIHATIEAVERRANARLAVRDMLLGLKR